MARIPLKSVEKFCARADAKRWEDCQRALVARQASEAHHWEQPPLEQPPQLVQKGPDLITSSFEESARAKCERREVPTADMVPGLETHTVTGAKRAVKVCGNPADDGDAKVPRCSEMTFIGPDLAIATGLPRGPAVRLCPRPYHEGPLVPVRTAQESLEVSRKFCSRGVVPEGSAVGRVEETIEHPDGEPEEIS